MLESRALRGAVAQLGERRVRNAKVEGSIPFRSTTFLPPGIKGLALRADPPIKRNTVRAGDSRDFLTAFAAFTKFTTSADP